MEVAWNCIATRGRSFCKYVMCVSLMKIVLLDTCIINARTQRAPSGRASDGTAAGASPSTSIILILHLLDWAFNTIRCQQTSGRINQQALSTNTYVCSGMDTNDVGHVKQRWYRNFELIRADRKILINVLLTVLSCLRELGGSFV